MLKRVLRYLIPLVAMAIAFIGNSSAATNEISSHLSDNISHFEFQDNCTFECSDGESTLFLPRQTTASAPSHLHGTSKRYNNAHKHNFEFTKSGKCFSTCIENYIHQHELSTHLSFTKSHHRLIGLGKLII
jgi:hypothetical protein